MRVARYVDRFLDGRRATVMSDRRQKPAKRPKSGTAAAERRYADDAAEEDDGFDYAADDVLETEVDQLRSSLRARRSQIRRSLTHEMTGGDGPDDDDGVEESREELLQKLRLLSARVANYERAFQSFRQEKEAEMGVLRDIVDRQSEASEAGDNAEELQAADVELGRLAKTVEERDVRIRELENEKKSQLAASQHVYEMRIQELDDRNKALQKDLKDMITK